MKETLKCIMLIDDNPDDNFFHERVIKKNTTVHSIVVKQSAQQALEFLKSADNNIAGISPDLIFLDINMPGMNGWDFLDEYTKLRNELKSHAIVVMLTTSENEDDVAKSKHWNIVSEFKTKPLTKEMLNEIIHKYFLVV